jgi:hypothetical protein
MNYENSLLLHFLCHNDSPSKVIQLFELLNELSLNKLYIVQIFYDLFMVCRTTYSDSIILLANN